MQRTTITLSDPLAEVVRREAQRRGTSVSALIRTLVAEALGAGADRPRDIPWAGLFDDPEMVPAARLDDTLEAEWADAVDRDRG